jgi:alkylhydroperoxidase/carboxymuconolactone decarboxylase family protein YurZ
MSRPTAIQPQAATGKARELLDAVQAKLKMRVGFSDGEIGEIIAHVALNIFTNYFINAAEVEVDFPKIARRQSA